MFVHNYGKIIRPQLFFPVVPEMYCQSVGLLCSGFDADNEIQCVAACTVQTSC